MAYHPFRDLPTKILAIVLAVVLWMFVTGEPVVERGLEIPIAFENVPVDLEIAGNPPDTVHIRARGPSSMIDRLEAGQAAAVLDLSDVRPGSQRFDMFAGHLDIPPGVEVTSVVPATLVLTLARVGSARSVPVVADIKGQPAPGRALGHVRTYPSHVEIIGPAARLEAVREAVTGPISVHGASTRVVGEAAVGVADSMVHLAAPVTARVVVDIVEADVPRTFQAVPVAGRDADAGRVPVLAPAQVTVAVRGPRALVEALDATAISAFVELRDLAGAGPGRYNLPVTVEAVDEFRVTRIDPPRVEVRLR